MLSKNAFSRLGGDQRGVAAVEFALCAPLLILFYFGVAELTEAIIAEHRASHAASVVADLVAQESTTTSAEVTDIFNVGVALLQPAPVDTLKMRVSAITADSTAKPKVVWSRGYGQSGRSTGLISGFPANLLAANESVIMAEVSYSYVSPLKQVLKTPLAYSETFYLKPRRSPAVTCSSC